MVHLQPDYYYLFVSKVLPHHVSKNAKKHSTSSVEHALGCSGAMLFAELNVRLHSLLSIFTNNADSVSLVKPLILVTLLL